MTHKKTKGLPCNCFTKERLLFEASLYIFCYCRSCPELTGDVFYSTDPVNSEELSDHGFFAGS